MASGAAWLAVSLSRPSGEARIGNRAKSPPAIGCSDGGSRGRMEGMREAKVKLSVTVSRDLVAAIDREVLQLGAGASRSSILEAWLRAASHGRAHDSLAERTAAYYRTRTPRQHADDDAWADVATREHDERSRGRR